MSTQVTPSTLTQSTATQAPQHGTLVRRRRHAGAAANSLLARGEPVIWLTGGALVLAMIMIVLLLALIIALGFNTFRPQPLLELRLRDGRVLMGELARTEQTTLTGDEVLGASPEGQSWLVAHLLQAAGADPPLLAQLEDRLARLQNEANDIRRRQQRARRPASKAIGVADSEMTAAANPFVRRDRILAAPTSQRTHEDRLRHSGLEQRTAALAAEMDAARQALEYFRSLPEIDGSALLQADESPRRAGIESLIELAGKANPDSVRFRRRMLRTGNYELTNEHFNWVADYEIAEGGESQPPQGALIERIAWGRFYGRPQSLLVTHRRSAGQDERELELLAEFIRGRQIAGSSVEKSSQIDDRLRELDSALQQKRDRATRAFVERFAKTTSDGQRLTFHTASGEEKTADELSAGDPLAAASISVVDPDSAWAKFQETHPQVLRWRKQRERLEKRALGKQFARQEAARLDVRQAELEHELTLLAQAEALLQVETQSAVLDERLAQGDEMVTVARRHFGPTSEMAALTIRLREAQRDELKQEQSALTAERTQLHSQLDRLPSHAQQVVLDYVEVERTAAAATGQIRKSIDELRELGSRYQLEMVTADGQTKTLAANDIVRAFQPNRLSRSSAFGVYLSRWWEFITQEPREANSEGGVMPAIWGTVVMTLIMSLAVVPCGVVAALYLREYAKSGPVISAIRIAINNLAGVPSIVFGVFGLGFFCYVIGAYIDGGPGNAGIQPLPPVRWYLTLAGLAVAATTGFLLGLASLRNGAASRRRWRRLAAYGGLASWLVATLLLIVVLFKSPYFHGLYEANLPNPHWGKGGVVWASLTLALLTLPVVIVATEEALSAVPNSMREGSFGCGASRWQTIWRIVLPHAMPGIMTGMILAMARGAGEVAPLMLVGAVKLAPELPIDLTAPFLHGSRSFMHLGFHIFDVGFQSQNSEAAKPMVYTTTLLLILIITLLNLLAVRLRAYLRRRFVTGHF